MNRLNGISTSTISELGNLSMDLHLGVQVDCITYAWFNMEITRNFEKNFQILSILTHSDIWNN